MTAPMPQPCSEWRVALAATHPADLTPEQRAALEAHLATCPACAAVYAHYQQLDTHIHHLPAPAPLEGLPPKLLALWAAEEHEEAGEHALVTSQIQEQPMRTFTPPTLPTPFPSGPLPPQRRFSRRFVSGLSAAAAVLVLIALTTAVLASRFHTSTSGSPTGTPATATVVPPQNTATPGPSNGYAVKVYFSKFSDTNPNNVYPVDRVSPTSAVATFAIQLLIAGPTLAERSQGYYSELNSLFSGPSGCDITNATPTGGPDFTLTLNMKGSTPQQGTATLQFCRQSSSSGVDEDGRIKAEITATLKQFSNIKNVVILTQSGQCFGDESGMNQCLK